MHRSKIIVLRVVAQHSGNSNVPYVTKINFSSFTFGKEIFLLFLPNKQRGSF